MAAMSGANEQHVKLLKQQLDRLTPGTKAHTKIKDELKRVNSEFSSSSGARRRGGVGGGGTRGGRAHSDHFHESAQGTRSRNGPQGQAFQQMKNKNRAASAGMWGGLGAVILGVSLSGATQMKEANKPSNAGTKRQRQNKRTIRTGETISGAGSGVATGSYLGGIFAKDAKGVAFAAGAGAGAAGTLSYLQARKMHPTNTKSSKQKMWVEYKRHGSTGQIIRVKRRNPHYMKPKRRGGKRR